MTYEERYKYACYKETELNDLPFNAPFTVDDCSFKDVDTIDEYTKAFGKNVNNYLFFPRFRKAVAMNIRDELLTHEKIFWQYQRKKNYFLMLKEDSDNLINVINNRLDEEVDISRYVETSFVDKIVEELIKNNYKNVDNNKWILRS